MNALKRVDGALAKFEAWLIIVFLGCMVIFTFFQVCLRGLYTHGGLQWANDLMGRLDWTDSFVRLLVLWLTFLGASLITRENKHIKIDFLSALLSPRWLSIREVVLNVVSVCVSAAMVKVCIDYIQLEREFGGTLFLGLPGWIGQLILPFGFASILMRFLIRALDRTFEILGVARP